VLAEAAFPWSAETAPSKCPCPLEWEEGLLESGLCRLLAPSGKAEGRSALKFEVNRNGIARKYLALGLFCQLMLH
jgi:hypothetical protein